MEMFLPRLERLDWGKDFRGERTSYDDRKKLQYQEKVTKEVKLVLKPAFARKAVTEEQYKEIMRKVVPKVCSAYDGRSVVNVKKIKVMVELYVEKFEVNVRKDEQKRMKKELDDLVISEDP